MARKDRHLGYAHIYTDVEIDLDEIITDIDTKDLVKVLEARGLHIAGSKLEACDLDLVNEAISDLKRGDVGEALLTLERLIEPKWKTPSECLADFAKHRGQQ
jgi:hypothetical protein